MVAGAFEELRRKLARHGFRPTRKLGQNFLLDPQLLACIAECLPLDRSALVLELGAGAGGLTRQLAQRAGRVVAVEIDRRLVAFLGEEMASWGEDAERVRLVEADGLGPEGLSPACLTALREEGAAERGFVCVSNLPYSAAGPFLAALAQAPLWPREVVCLCQLEMATRIVAAPGSRKYGTLSVLLSLAWHAEILRRLPPEVFRPRPRVVSALLQLSRPRTEFLARPAAERRSFGRFLQAIFGGRRKVLRNALKRVEGVNASGIEKLPQEWLAARAEQRTAEELWRISEAATSDRSLGDRNE